MFGTKHATNRRGCTKFHIYFAEAPAVGLIKIGITNSVKERLSTLRCSSPVDLSLLLSVRGTARQEWAIHRRFSAERDHGEWFTASLRLRTFIDSLKSMNDRGVSAVLTRMRTPVKRPRDRQLMLAELVA